MRIIQSEHDRPLNRLAVGPGGLIVATSGAFHLASGVEGFDAVTGARRWVIADDRAGFRCVAFLLDGTYLFTADISGERLYTLAPNGAPIEAARTGWAQSAVTAVDDRVFVGRSGSTPAVTCWQAPHMNLLWKRDGQSEFRDSDTEFGPEFAFHPGTDRFVLSVREGATHPKRQISVRDASTGAPRVTIPFDPATPVWQLAFTADGSKVLVRTDDRKVQMFDAGAGQPSGELVHPGRAYVTAIAVHLGGAAACARTDGTVTFWNPETCDKLRTYDWKAGKLASIAFSRDGALCAAGTDDGKVVVWDLDL